ARIGFRVSAGWPPFIGSAEAEPYTLRLSTQSGDIPGQVLSGTLRRKALIPAGVPGAIATVLALAMGGLALVAITRPPIGPNVVSPAVPTVASSQGGLGGGGSVPSPE